MRPDCRDFLRTGRCKYGESCKYNHPTNVESGGGVKPDDPSEPLFPVRPTEPPCQYFLKHGTCKFGQSCKFNHPSGCSLVDGGGGGGGSGSLPSGHLVFVTTNDASTHLMTSSTSVQVLPQRLNEPNCIYFLRNGKCKYGATCKFHHPLDAFNRNNQLRHAQTTNMSPTPNNATDKSLSAVSGGFPSQIQQQSVTYATASNISYLPSQRLHPITERARPQQPTHVLLPDGQIAVILDPQSLQHVTELSVQDRPKYYISQTDGSIETHPSLYQNNKPIVISPMLTATTRSISSTTFDSCIDLNNGHFQGQTTSRSPQMTGSAGNLSAYGSVDSGSNALGDREYSQQGSGQVRLEQVRLEQGRLGLGQASFPQYSAWPMNEGRVQSNQVRRSPSGAETFDSQRHVANIQKTSESAAMYFWPSSESLSSIPNTDHDIQAGRSYGSAPNFSPYGSSNSVGQAAHRSYSAERNAYADSSASSEQMRSRHGNNKERQESSGSDEGLTMMTSALLTMMDRHDSSSAAPEASAQPRPPHSHVTAATVSQNLSLSHEMYPSRSDQNLRERAAPARPPPGMSPPGMSNVHPGNSFDFKQHLNPPGSPLGRGGYFFGGYDEQPPSSPPWGVYREDL
ncbi:LOW QUALITY PROTEIN: hypothetical protein ACHAW5_001100 [Stephanodiscus triporus]|uniref:C3H1-type domain-containing protein n=1 Tax=Stephanodiscus triporus TaxID=2934178 RepID=A0ABD3PX63_9STRA